jgi:hypothetical protein
MHSLTTGRQKIFIKLKKSSGKKPGAGIFNGTADDSPAPSEWDGHGWRG